MDFKKAVTSSLASGNPTTLSNKLKVVAVQQDNQIQVKLLCNNNLVWTDSNSLDKVVSDLEAEFHNFN